MPAKIFWILTTVVLLLGCTSTPADTHSHSFYLVRHAEKQDTKDTPHLTECGQLRALSLSKYLSDANIKQIFSTQYNRTYETALPLAKKQGLPIQYYQPRALADFASQLQKIDDNTLIVGHSNTTPMLVNALVGSNYAWINEDEYDVLFKINYTKEHMHVEKLTHTFTCPLKGSD
ncbi:SixA phosphatase family protein [Thalassotalea agarivorans]|uniref:Histidine phosphatase superfamily (Branch 1) n=1 Tax=Thalassotalea agarivorans TaxID=349064 RepID=A0A1I0GR63_THASX|nr:phosphoglycerate mutase family protein [Thalassotalea agarivorans]SET72909.1 Histidine phosphatase superfamily (branch 1) [Thalassotalea agarivorans]